MENKSPTSQSHAGSARSPAATGRSETSDKVRAGESPLCLNLGCGSRFHPEWTNIDVVSNHPNVRAHDLRKGIPFPEGTFDVVYHSHILEHFARDKALSFVRECNRVLKRGGVIRIAIPDLEGIARLYLQAVDKAAQQDPQWEHHYDWMMLELYDQVLREKSGGGIVEYLSQNSIPNEAFIVERFGGEAKNIMRSLRDANSRPKTVLTNSKPFLTKLRNVPSRIRSRLVSWLLGPERMSMLEVESFRASGELHRWMYDRFSLARLLQRAGFQNPTPRQARDSQISGWTRYALDTDADGTVYKPDSLYMEAVKP